MPLPPVPPPLRRDPCEATPPDSLRPEPFRAPLPLPEAFAVRFLDDAALELLPLPEPALLDRLPDVDDEPPSAFRVGVRPRFFLPPFLPLRLSLAPEPPPPMNLDGCICWSSSITSASFVVSGSSMSSRAQQKWWPISS